MCKKILSAVLLFLLCLPGLSAAKENDTTMTTLQNDTMIVSLDDHGQLIQLQNRETGRKWLQGTVSGYQFTVNTSTGDLWKTVRGDTLTLTPLDASSYSAQITEHSLTVIHTHPVNNSTITITQTWTLHDDELTLDTSIDNACDDAVVTDMIAIMLTGLADAEEPLDLLWPDKEGALYTDVMQHTDSKSFSLSASYPSLMSMQYLALYNPVESLYFAVHDTACEYKDFSFTADQGSATISCKQYPFVGAQDSKSLATTHIALDQGDWYASADRYRAYLLANGFCKDSGQMISTFTGIAANCLSRYKDRYEHVYINGSAEHKDMAQLSRENQALYGTDLTIFMGWHEKGFDSRYPDYEFISEYGGADAFRQGAEEVHAQGGKVIPYMNLHIADTMSKWYSNNGTTCAILTKYQSVLHESYGTGLDYVAMCPMAQAWQDALVDAARRLRQNGADGLWLDQMMEMPGNLCYNKAHGHTTPATAYAEGYAQLMSRIDAVMQEVEGDYFYCCEGVCDAYIQYIDICGLMWSRLPGSDATIAQQVTRYTMPCKFIGLNSAGASANDDVYYAHAWTLANGMLCRESSRVVKRFANLAQQYPEVYFDGRYMDVRGLSKLPENITAGIMLSTGGTRAAIQLANTGNYAICVTLNLTGYGTVVTMHNAENGVELTPNAGGWEITVPARSLSAVLVDLLP